MEKGALRLYTLSHQVSTRSATQVRLNLMEIIRRLLDSCPLHDIRRELYKDKYMTNISLQYVKDKNGIVSAVQIPFSDWEKVVASLREYEQMLQVKSDLNTAFTQVRQIREGKRPKKSLAEALVKSPWS
jgi:hypothetical protein